MRRTPPPTAIQKRFGSRAFQSRIPETPRETPRPDDSIAGETFRPIDASHGGGVYRSDPMTLVAHCSSFSENLGRGRFWSSAISPPAHLVDTVLRTNERRSQNV